MSEKEVIDRTGAAPITVTSLVTDLSALGVTAGMTLLVHASLSALGWVCGGPVAVVQALQHTLSPAGTLVMPTHSGDLSDPAGWQNPPVPKSWWEPIRQTMPAFEPDKTPSRGMGAIPECFRTQRDVRRSLHPQFSFAAWGHHRDAVVGHHGLGFGLGETSPLAKIYQLAGWVLLLGVGHDSNTSLHLAEYRANYPGKKYATFGTAMQVDGQRRWVTFQDLELDSDDFVLIGDDFARESGAVRRGRVGLVNALLMPQRTLVDYGVAWIERHRRG